ncbi:MAG TPA: GtrA family protein [Rhodocyclaceae bacterium]|nr:GtrA family protein [Rhodocyclaceae bacterium]
MPGFLNADQILRPEPVASGSAPTRQAMAPLILKQFLQYVLVGGVAFVIDFSILFLLTDRFELHYLTSATAAFLIGLAVNYVLCIAWIFDVRTIANRHHEFAIFASIGISGLTLNTGLMYVLTDLADVHYLLSKLIAAGLILIFNFTLRRTILFSELRRYRVPIDGIKQ